MEFNVEDGRRLIDFARKNIIYFLKNNTELPVPNDLKQKYSKKLGAFVTLNEVSENQKMLRGCIGITQAVYPLIETISKISISSALEDPRFPQVSLEELNSITIEISILTTPELIRVDNPNEDYFKKIKIGRDGLFIERDYRRGLLLPQVPIDNNRNWDVETFLKHLCMKAGLPQDAWKNKDTKISKFQALIFEEEKPNGEIHQKQINMGK